MLDEQEVMLDHPVERCETFLCRREDFVCLKPVCETPRKALGKQFVKGVRQGDWTPIINNTEIATFEDEDSGGFFPLRWDLFQLEADVEYSTNNR
ncbi:hypothetical protein TNCT_476311 [Trichonephila clavata]|uniref:Uncharacterized protein n=1 Tax=Trichonephila clavata TaxID=2740835 RepID=A0A8X6L4K3_TRICU|nr:hypothetical protein TNCT_476311 [Trichonephila clavata]